MALYWAALLLQRVHASNGFMQGGKQLQRGEQGTLQEALGIAFKMLMSVDGGASWFNQKMTCGVALI